MARVIVKVRDRYCEWSTISDRPRTRLMTEGEFRDYYREEYGRSGMRDLDRRMERVEKHGTSALPKEPVDTFIRHNRAGPDEQELTIDQIYERYTAETTDQQRR